MKKLFFIYTNPRFLTALYQPVMQREYENNSEIQVRFVCDNAILMDSLENHAVPTSSVEKRLERLVDNCIDAGADCIVVGCTVMNLATEKIAVKKRVPILNIDDALVNQLKLDGRKRVAILSHAQDNAETIERRLTPEGIQSKLFVLPGAAEDLTLYQKQIEVLDTSFDAIALAHISADDLLMNEEKIPIYRSGRLCIRKINEIMMKE